MSNISLKKSSLAMNIGVLDTFLSLCLLISLVTSSGGQTENDDFITREKRSVTSKYGNFFRLLGIAYKDIYGRTRKKAEY